MQKKCIPFYGLPGIWFGYSVETTIQSDEWPLTANCNCPSSFIYETRRYLIKQ
jgi:hypothetical protein